MGVTSGPTTILNAPRVLEARNLSTEQLDSPDLDDDIGRSQQKNIENLYDFRNPPPPSPFPYGRNGDKRGFSRRHTESSPLRSIVPISIVPLNTPHLLAPEWAESKKWKYYIFKYTTTFRSPNAA